MGKKQHSVEVIVAMLREATDKSKRLITTIIHYYEDFTCWMYLHKFNEEQQCGNR